MEERANSVFSWFEKNASFKTAIYLFVGFGKGVILCGEGEVVECWVCSEVSCGVGVMAEFAVLLPSITDY